MSEDLYHVGRLHGVDTNVLVRYYAGDDAERSPLARALVARAEQRGENLFVSLPVLCELVWTFAGARYRAGREQLADLVTGLLDSPVFEVQARSLVRQALEDFRHGGADFADYLIGRCCEAAGCAATFTFDAELATSPGFRRPGGDSTP